MEYDEETDRWLVKLGGKLLVRALHANLSLVWSTEACPDPGVSLLPSTVTSPCCTSNDTPFLSTLLSTSRGIHSTSITSILSAVCPDASP